MNSIERNRLPNTDLSQYHFDVLLERKFLVQATGSDPIEYSVTSKARAHVFENMNF